MVNLTCTSMMISKEEGRDWLRIRARGEALGLLAARYKKKKMSSADRQLQKESTDPICPNLSQKPHPVCHVHSISREEDQLKILLSSQIYGNRKYS